MGRGGCRPGAGRKPNTPKLALPAPDAPHNQIESKPAIGGAVDGPRPQIDPEAPAVPSVPSIHLLKAGQHR
jgi:hypothetical protein